MFPGVRVTYQATVAVAHNKKGTIVTDIKHRPLSGLRVLDFGHYIAAPMTGLLLADQGAEVICVERPCAPLWDANTQTTLARGKRTIVANLKDPSQRETILALARDCDIVLENFRPGVMDRLGLGYEALRAINPALIYVSLPAYGRHDERAALPAWDSTISAACGLFTDVSVGGNVLNLPPTYTPLPMPSIYAGLWGANATLAALYARTARGTGERIEVSLMDAAMSAAAGVFSMVVDQPARYNAPPISRRWLDNLNFQGLGPGLTAKAHRVVEGLMPPFFRNYTCGDGGQVFICAIDNANQIAKLLDAMDLGSSATKLGFVVGDVLDVPPSRNNINAYRGNSRLWKKLRNLLEERFATASAEVWSERLARAGVPAVRQHSLEEWAEHPVMHETKVLTRATDGSGRVEPGLLVDLVGDTVSSLASMQPTAGTHGDWSSERRFVPGSHPNGSAAGDAPLAGVRVLDLANVIAGPAAGRTLAEFGAEVTHFSAVVPRMGPRMALLYGIDVNQGKKSLGLDLQSPEGQAVLERLLPDADVLIYNKLPAQARRLDADPERVHEINNHAVICIVAAYSGAVPGGWENRPAYDPVVQALVGIMQRFGTAAVPAVHGTASCIDYFTGFAGGFGALLGLLAQQQGERRLVARTSLVRTGGWIQLPLLSNPTRVTPSGLLSRGGATFDRLYPAKKGWVHIGPDPRGMTKESDHPVKTEAWLADEIKVRSADDASEWARSQGLVAQPVLSSRAIRAAASYGLPRGTPLEAKLAAGSVVRIKHPAGETYFAPEATWVRFDNLARRRLIPAPQPGEHSVEILLKAGLTREEIDRLITLSVVTEGWPGLTSYLPA